MTLWAFYWLVLKRAWEHSFDRARKLGFLVTIGAGILLFLAPRFLPPSRSVWVNKGVEFAWTIPLAFLFLSFFWLMICAPYQLYLEASLTLDVYIKAGVSSEERASIRDELSNYVLKAQNILDRGTDYRANTSVSIQHAFAWAREVEGYLEERLGKHYRARFRLDAQLPSMVIHVGSTMPPVLTEPMNQRCANLLEIIKDLS
jgi:hypothetical protein